MGIHFCVFPLVFINCDCFLLKQFIYYTFFLKLNQYGRCMVCSGGHYFVHEPVKELLIIIHMCMNQLKVKCTQENALTRHFCHRKVI